MPQNSVFLTFPDSSRWRFWWGGPLYGQGTEKFQISKGWPLGCHIVITVGAKFCFLAKEVFAKHWIKSQTFYCKSCLYQFIFILHDCWFYSFVAIVFSVKNPYLWSQQTTFLNTFLTPPLTYNFLTIVLGGSEYQNLGWLLSGGGLPLGGLYFLRWFVKVTGVEYFFIYCTKPWEIIIKISNLYVRYVFSEKNIKYMFIHKHNNL